MVYDEKAMEQIEHLTDRWNGLPRVSFSPINNFGDKLNEVILHRYIGRYKFVPREERYKLLPLGSILETSQIGDMIWGTGLMYEKEYKAPEHTEILAVRGKLTRKLIKGVYVPEVYGDPGLLMPLIYHPKIEKKYKVGYVPHYVDKGIWKEGFMIDVQQDVFKAIDEILSCEKIISSSLHGLIVAEAYGIPAMWVKLSNNVLGDGFKFRDYASSTNRTIESGKELPPVPNLDELQQGLINAIANADLNKITKEFIKDPLTHIVVSRMWYERKEDLLKRIKIYEANLLPALLNQTNQDFDIGVLCNKKHKEIIQNIHPRIIPFFTKKKGQTISPSNHWHIFSNWDDIIGLKKYDIQTNVDSDDIVSKDFIKIIKDSITEEKRTLIHFQPLLRDFYTGIVKKIRIDYNDTYISACYSLYQPDKKNYVYIGQDSHTSMYKYADKIIKIPEGHYWVNIHDNNNSSTMKLAGKDIDASNFHPFNPEEEREKRKAQAEKLRQVIEAYKIRNPIKYKQKEKELMDQLNSLL